MNIIVISIVVLGIFVLITFILTIISLTQISVIYKKAATPTKDEDEIHGTLVTTSQPNISFLDNVRRFKLAGKGPFMVDYGTIVDPNASSGIINFSTTFTKPPIVVCQIINASENPEIQSIKVANVTNKTFDYHKSYLINDSSGIQPNVGDGFSWFAIGS